MKKLITLLLTIISTNTYAEFAHEHDARNVLILNEIHRHHVLSEMRVLLSGTQNILAALAKDDMKAVANAAKPLGMSMSDNAENHLQGVLPKEFMQLGVGVHKAFDKIAEDAISVQDSKHTLQQLSELMGQCEACHASYQIQTKH